MSEQNNTHGHMRADAGQRAEVPRAVARAEVLVDRLGKQIGHWTDNLSFGLQVLWARAREEGEDIWAEASDIREHNHLGTGLTNGVKQRRPATSSKPPNGQVSAARKTGTHTSSTKRASVAKTPAKPARTRAPKAKTATANAPAS
jgi:hypothetical protein